MAKKRRTCADCHYFIRVNGRPGCTNIPQKPGKPCYKFLKSMNACSDFWPIRRRVKNEEDSRSAGNNLCGSGGSR